MHGWLLEVDRLHSSFTSDGEIPITIAHESIGNLRCSRRCRVRCKIDHSIANNVVQQKRSFSMPGNHKWESEKSWAQAMRPIGREGGDGSAQHGRSMISTIALLWSPYVIGQTIIFLPCLFFLSIYLHSFFSPNLSGRRLDVYHTSTQWYGPSANLECRSERCCTRLAANAGPKKVAKNCHLGTIPQLSRAISSQLRHVSTIGKKC